MNFDLGIQGQIAEQSHKCFKETFKEHIWSTGQKMKASFSGAFTGAEIFNLHLNQTQDQTVSSCLSSFFSSYRTSSFFQIGVR